MLQIYCQKRAPDTKPLPPQSSQQSQSIAQPTGSNRLGPALHLGTAGSRDTMSFNHCCETYEDRRLQRAWKGGYIRFRCRGLLVSTGKDWRPLAGAVSAHLIGVILVLAFPVPFLTNRFDSPAFAAVAAVLCCASLFFFARTSLMDPGILPRCSKPVTKGRLSRPPRVQMFVDGAENTELRYCDQCHLYQPPRTCHCPICNNCIRTYDHHCPWIGNCVGERNYPYFVGFVVTVNTLIIYTIALVVVELITRINDKGNNVGDALIEGLGSIIVGVLAFGTSWFTLTLLGFHFMLLVRNKTTYEHIRNFGSFHHAHNPLGVGLRACTNLCCKFKGPSYVEKWMAREDALLEDDNVDHPVEAVYYLGNEGVAKEVPLAEFSLDKLQLLTKRNRELNSSRESGSGSGSGSDQVLRETRQNTSSDETEGVELIVTA